MYSKINRNILKKCYIISTKYITILKIYAAKKYMTDHAYNLKIYHNPQNPVVLKQVY